MYIICIHICIFIKCYLLSANLFLLILQMSDEKSSGGEFINVAETKMYGTKAVIKADIAPYNSKVGIMQEVALGETYEQWIRDFLNRMPEEKRACFRKWLEETS